MTVIRKTLKTHPVPRTRTLICDTVRYHWHQEKFAVSLNAPVNDCEKLHQKANKLFNATKKNRFFRRNTANNIPNRYDITRYRMLTFFATQISVSFWYFQKTDLNKEVNNQQAHIFCVQTMIPEFTNTPQLSTKTEYYGFMSATLTY